MADAHDIVAQQKAVESAAVQMKRDLLIRKKELQDALREVDRQLGEIGKVA